MTRMITMEEARVRSDKKVVMQISLKDNDTSKCKSLEQNAQVPREDNTQYSRVSGLLHHGKERHSTSRQSQILDGIAMIPRRKNCRGSLLVKEKVN